MLKRIMTQLDHYVMELIKDSENPLIREDFHKLAERYPTRWEKYRNLLDEFPCEEIK